VTDVLVLNGPNLGRLGHREPDIYGRATHADLVAACQAEAAELGWRVDVRQTDDEAQMLTWLHECIADAVVLNPAAWTHTSVALRDAVAMVPVPVVEVHLSNPMAREEFRHTSFTAGLATAVVSGFGIAGYRLALRGLAAVLPATP
jgi:3-dehydroquinate dehydratase-2